MQPPHEVPHQLDHLRRRLGPGRPERRARRRARATRLTNPETAALVALLRVGRLPWPQYSELLAIDGLANETNRLVTALDVAVDPAFL